METKQYNMMYDVNDGSSLNSNLIAASVVPAIPAKYMTNYRTYNGDGNEIVVRLALIMILI